MSFRKYIENLPMPSTEEERFLLESEPFLVYKKGMILNEYFCSVCDEATTVNVYHVRYRNNRTVVAVVHPEGKTEKCINEYRKLTSKNNFLSCLDKMTHNERVEELIKALSSLDEVSAINMSIIMNYNI